MEKGEIGAPEVRFAELPVNESGNAADGVIQVNRDMAVSGVQTFEYKGRPFSTEWMIITARH